MLHSELLANIFSQVVVYLAMPRYGALLSRRFISDF